MATTQCYKPCEQNNHPKTTTAHHENRHDNKKSEHSFTEKVKEATHKVFTHKDQHGSSTNCSTGTAKAHGHDGYGGHGHGLGHGHGGHSGHDEGHCMPKLRDHNNKKKKKTHKKDKHSGSSSESDSDNETCKKKC